MEHCILHNHAGVAELADALDFEIECPRGHAGSHPGRRYHKRNKPREMVSIFLGLFFQALSVNGCGCWQVCFAPRDICTPVKQVTPEVTMSLYSINSGERPLTGTDAHCSVPPANHSSSEVRNSQPHLSRLIRRLSSFLYLPVISFGT